MIKSMTGFASVTREDERATMSVTIRAVNHRYLDLQLRVPQSLAADGVRRARALVAKQRRARPRRAERLAAAAADPGRRGRVQRGSSAAALEAALEQARDRGLVSRQR